MWPLVIGHLGNSWSPKPVRLRDLSTTPRVASDRYHSSQTEERPEKPPLAEGVGRHSPTRIAVLELAFARGPWQPVQHYAPVDYNFLELIVETLVELLWRRLSASMALGGLRRPYAARNTQ
jgi:hypothetical protein